MPKNRNSSCGKRIQVLVDRVLVFSLKMLNLDDFSSFSVGMRLEDYSELQVIKMEYFSISGTLNSLQSTQVERHLNLSFCLLVSSASHVL